MEHSVQAQAQAGVAPIPGRGPAMHTSWVATWTDWVLGRATGDWRLALAAGCSSGLDRAGAGAGAGRSRQSQFWLWSSGLVRAVRSNDETSVWRLEAEWLVVDEGQEQKKRHGGEEGRGRGRERERDEDAGADVGSGLWDVVMVLAVAGGIGRGSGLALGRDGLLPCWRVDTGRWTLESKWTATADAGAQVEGGRWKAGDGEFLATSCILAHQATSGLDECDARKSETGNRNTTPAGALVPDRHGPASLGQHEEGRKALEALAATQNNQRTPAEKRRRLRGTLEPQARPR
ncbi:hypothetical protein EG329_012280 [Mollisiaceae sp. DMI_Dod_QoI]|nr:hypothetical protein EG329_012280 [Helotiales sp. DMI_Dod_QoI]